MGNKNLLVFLGILVLVAVAFWAIWPLDASRLGRKLNLGLDLKGGSYLVYEADLSKKDPAQSADSAMNGVTQKIERRVNAYGVSEAIIQRQGGNRILVQLPGVKNINEAMDLIGKTAQLDFREQVDEQGNPKWISAKAIGSDQQEKELTGKYLKPNSQVVLAPQTNEPEVAFEFNSEGAVLFEQITQRNLNKPLGIFLDDVAISVPTVRAVIRDKGIIEGLNINEARLLAIQLNSGSLDLPLKVIQQQDVDATLGKDSIRKSLLAGSIGLLMVLVFMTLYYRLPGAVACVALFFYGILVLAVFKLIGATLTLPGVAAFVVSLGMAVDANVLIFERMKEELRAGRTLIAAMEAGFIRSWPAIRDSNLTTLLTSAILYWFGNQFGAAPVKGFAVTLFIGVSLSMFSALIISRNLLRLLAATPVARWIPSYAIKTKTGENHA